MFEFLLTTMLNIFDRIICIAGEWAWHPLHENEAIFSKNDF